MTNKIFFNIFRGKIKYTHTTSSIKVKKKKKKKKRVKNQEC